MVYEISQYNKSSNKASILSLLNGFLTTPLKHLCLKLSNLTSKSAGIQAIIGTLCIICFSYLGRVASPIIDVLIDYQFQKILIYEIHSKQI